MEDITLQDRQKRAPAMKKNATAKTTAVVRATLNAIAPITRSRPNCLRESVSFNTV
jgi:hypothetical protein